MSFKRTDCRVGLAPPSLIGGLRPTLLILISILLLVGTGAAVADIKLPAIIGDNMVLQQGGKVSIWGWADPGEEVTVGVSWNSMKFAVTADKDGKWTFKIKPIAELLKEEMNINKEIWIDPFAGESSPAEITNDINPERNAKYHLHAVEFQTTI